MEEKLLKYCKYGLWGLMGIIVVVLAICAFKGEASADLQMYMTYVLIALLASAILFSPIYGAIVNPGNLKKIGIAIGLFVVVALAAWIFSPGATLSEEYLESMGITAKAEAICDFLMMVVYIMLGGTLLTVIVSAVAKLFK